MRPYLTAAIIGTSVIAAAIGFASPILGHDDYWIRSIADGTYTGEPSERLIFINTVFGWILRGGYSLAPGIAWYAFLLYGLLALALSVVTWVLAPHPMSVRLAALFLGIFFVWRPLAILSWTETSLLVVGSGFVLALCAPSTRRVAAVAGLLIGIGFMVRREALGITLALVPAFWVARSRWRHMLVVALVAGIVIAFAHLYDTLHYSSDPEWAEWSEFENTRRSLHGSPRLVLDSDMRDLLDRIGWSDNDLRLFRAWYYADGDVYSTESIETILESRRWVLSDPGGQLAEVVRRNATGFLVVMTALALAGARRWWLAALTAVWLLGLFTAMEVTYRSRARVESVIIVIAIVVLLLHARSVGPPPRPVLIVILLVLTLPGIVLVRSAAMEARIARSAEMTTLVQLDPTAVYIQVGSGLTLNGIDPFTSGINPIAVVLTGWTVRSPHFVLHAREAGIGNIYLDPIERQDVYLIAGESQVGSVVEFAREHYDRNAVAEQILQLNREVYVWQLNEHP